MSKFYPYLSATSCLSHLSCQDTYEFHPLTQHLKKAVEESGYFRWQSFVVVIIAEMVFRNTPGHRGMTEDGWHLFKKVTFPNFTEESEGNQVDKISIFGDIVSRIGHIISLRHLSVLQEQQWDKTAKSEDDDEDNEYPLEDDEFPVEELEVIL